MIELVSQSKSTSYGTGTQRHCGIQQRQREDENKPVMWTNKSPITPGCLLKVSTVAEWRVSGYRYVWSKQGRMPNTPITDVSNGHVWSQQGRMPSTPKRISPTTSTSRDQRQGRVVYAHLPTLTGGILELHGGHSPYQETRAQALKTPHHHNQRQRERERGTTTTDPTSTT